MLSFNLALAGLAVGSIAALSGMGLLVSYRATGVFNVGFGAIAMIVAYLLWQAVHSWNIPLWLAAPIVLLVVAPAIGVAADWLVFAPLQRRAATAAERLVASIGIFVLLVGIAFAVWGGTSHSGAPSLLPAGSFLLPGGAAVRYDTLFELGVALGIALLLALVTRGTRFGVEVLAVVNRRELAELSGVRADRVSRAGWAFGTFVAGLTGVLLAPYLRLDPYGLTLLVLETMAVAVVARLSSIRVTILAALAIGIAQSELTQLHPRLGLQPVAAALVANLFVVALLIALLLLPRLEETGVRDSGVARLAGRRDTPTAHGWWVPYAFLGVLPFGFTGADLGAAQLVPALAIILVSIVTITGYSGQISLGTAGYAGLGSLLAARLASAHMFGLPPLPGLAALFLGALLVTPVGFLTGWPAIRRRGLFLMLTTFAVGAVISRFVFDQPWSISGLVVSRPAPFAGDRMFYLFELVCLGLVLLMVRNLHIDRLGRALLATRDSEAGAEASGVNVRWIRVFIFTIGAGIAALGGALFDMSTRSFDPTSFDPIQALIWFAAVVVFGTDSAAGAVLAAGAIVALDYGIQQGASAIAIGVLAVLLGRMPGGIAGLRRRVSGGAGQPLGSAGQPRRTPVGQPRRTPAAQLTPAGRLLLVRIRARRADSGSGS